MVVDFSILGNGAFLWVPAGRSQCWGFPAGPGDVLFLLEEQLKCWVLGSTHAPAAGVEAHRTKTPRATPSGGGAPIR